MELNKYIDHTVLKATATIEDIKKLCDEAKKYKFFSVCVNSSFVTLAKEELKETEVKIAAVVGFPLGAMTKEAKIFEARECIENGADEIDMVINIGFLKSGLVEKVEEEIKEIKKAIGDKILKVIFETCYLTKDEKIAVAKACVRAKADFVKTSTGFGTDGATVEDIQLMKDIIENNCQIKASGGIRDFETAKKYINMGVTRLGTSSGVQLVTTGKSIEGQY